MKRRTRLIFFVLVPLALAVGGVTWALSRVAVAEREVRRALPTTTQVVTEPAGVKWSLRRSRPFAGAGLADERTWYVAYLGGMGPPGRTLPVMALNVIQGSFTSATGRGGGLMFREPIVGSPLRADRVLYLPMHPSDVVAMDLDTRQAAWTANLGAPVAALAQAGGRLLAWTAGGASGLDAVGGRVLWSYTAPGPLTTGGGLGKQYACVGTDAALHVLDAASGKLLRDVALSGLRGDVVVDGETAYVCGRAATDARPLVLTAVDLPTGRTRWQWRESAARGAPDPDVDRWRVHGPVLANGTLYLSFADRLCAVDAATGGERWRWQDPEEGGAYEQAAGGAPAAAEWRRRVVGPPAVIGGVVYASSHDKANAFQRVTGLDASSGREVWRFVASSSWWGDGGRDLPPFGAGGLLFCPLGGRLFAITDDLHPPAKAPPPLSPDARGLNVPWASGVAASAVLLLIITIVLGRSRAAVALACLAICGLTVWAWLRSYEGEHFVGQRVTERASPFVGQITRGVTSSRGALTFGVRHDVWEASVRRIPAGNVKTNWLWMRTPDDEPAAIDRGLGLTEFRWTRRARPSGTKLGDKSETSLTVPHWAVAAALALVPLAWLSGVWRDRRRFPKGHCPQCGYDLRGIPQRCPECGLEVGSPV